MPITLQMIFDAAWQAFIVEGKPPAQENNFCRYLTSDGRKCAVGLCIPDGHPAQQYIHSLPHLLNEYPNLFGGSLNAYDHDLNRFQLELHDELCRGGAWTEDLEARRASYLEVAKQFGLVVPSSDNLSPIQEKESL
jgi:hypothetical protein